MGAITLVAKNDGGGGGSLDDGVPGGDGGVVAVGFGLDVVVDARVAEAVGFSDCGAKGGIAARVSRGALRVVTC